MDSEEGFEIEPNRVAEYYRNFQPVPTSAKVEKHLEFIDVYENGNTLLGSSDLSGRYWKGSLFTYELPADILVKNTVAGIGFPSTVTDGKYMENGYQFVIGEDSGTLNILGLTRMLDEKSPQHIVLQCKASEHDDSITSLDVFPDKTRVVTGSLDCCIKVWDCNAMVAENTYRPAHSQGVNSVATNILDSNIFASGSQDHLALLWDQRQEKPAQLVLQSNVAVTAVAFQPSLPIHLLAIGDATGTVTLVDTRKNNEVHSSSKILKRAVFKLKFCPYSVNTNLLAACSDGNQVIVVDCEAATALSVVYEDTRHNDFVRGLSWTPMSGLYSCGWDSQVLKHQPIKQVEKVCTTNHPGALTITEFD